MRSQILQFLRAHTEEYMSGEEISRQLAVSRTAIWKHMQALRQEGYEIESHPRRGYRLLGIPQRLLPAEVKSGLTTKLLGQADILHFDVVTSTNTEAKKAANEGCPDGTLIIGEEQSNGRGRMARGWFSPLGQGIWFSVVLRPPFQPYDAPKCTLLAAVAVTRAIRAVTGVDCGIKWPNDILYQGRKLVGILTEMSAEMDAINYIVIGTGINVNISESDFPPELRAIGVSLATAAGRPVERLPLLQAVLTEMDSLYAQARQEGFTAILDEWRALSVTLGQAVTVLCGDESYAGTAVDIDADGALLVDTATGRERVLAGDVSIRPRQG